MSFWLSGAAPLLAQTNSGLVEEIPELRPAKREIAPGYWEQNRRWILPTGAGVIVAAAFAIWFLSRPKAPVVLSAEEQARVELEALRERAEDGALLSSVSQTIRHYFTGAFGLTQGELNTKEFSGLIAGEERVGGGLAEEVGKFLRECDERKFAPQNRTEPMGAVAKAFKLIDSAEGRLRSLREAEAQAAASK